MSVALKIYSDKDEFYFVAFVLISHEGGIVDIIFDGPVEDEWDSDFGILDFL